MFPVMVDLRMQPLYLYENLGGTLLSDMLQLHLMVALGNPTRNNGRWSLLLLQV